MAPFNFIEITLYFITLTLQFFLKIQASELKKVSLEKYLIVNEEDNPQTESSILSMTFRVRKQLIKEAKIQIR